MWRRIATSTSACAPYPAWSASPSTFTTPLGGSIWDTDIEDRSQVRRQLEREPGQPRAISRRSARRSSPAATSMRATSPAAPGSPSSPNHSSNKFLKGPPIGQHFVVPDDRGRAGLDLEIVGVVSDQKYLDIRETNPKIFFLPSSQELGAAPTAALCAAIDGAARPIDRGHHRDGGGIRSDGDDPLRARSIRRSPRRCCRSA